MPKQRKHYSAELKAKVALEALKGQQTVNEIASRYGVHPNLVTNWKKLALEQLPDLFSDRRNRAARDEEELKAQLYQQIGQLKVERALFAQGTQRLRCARPAVSTLSS